MKRYIIMTAVLSMVLMSTIVFASGSHEGGRQVWKKNCRLACHEGKTPESPILSPNSKTQFQWKNSFADNKAYIFKFHNNNELKHITENQWEAIYDFVFHHAHDSDNPEDCMGNNGELVR